MCIATNPGSSCLRFMLAWNYAPIVSYYGSILPISEAGSAIQQNEQKVQCTYTLAISTMSLEFHPSCLELSQMIVGAYPRFIKLLLLLQGMVKIKNDAVSSDVTSNFKTT